MNNKQLEYAIELSESLNFSNVAEKFGISQPALSKQISNLEKNIGAILFDRNQTPIKLTAAGEYFFKEAKELLYKEKQLYSSMENFASGKFGNLTIGISPFRALYLMPELLKKIRNKYPDVKIVLHEDSSDNLRKMAADGKFDFAIANLPVDESILSADPIEQDKLVLAVPENMLSLLNCKTGNNLSEIDFKHCENLPFVVASKTQEMRILFEKICRESDIRPRIATEVIGLATAWAMTRAGIGATLLPLQFINSVENNNTTRLFIPKCDLNVRQPAIITRRGQYLSEYAKYAIDILKS